MLYKVLVTAHVLGACVWVGGHLVLMGAVLPGALRRRDPDAILQFERGYGRLGLGALLVQLATGVWLAGHWIGGWAAVWQSPTPITALVAMKVGLLIATLGIAGYAHHRVLGRLDAAGLPRFAALSGLTTTLAVLMLVLGVGIRTGGL